MKIECDIKPNWLFAPQLVGLVSSMDLLKEVQYNKVLSVLLLKSIF